MPPDTLSYKDHFFSGRWNLLTFSYTIYMNQFVNVLKSPPPFLWVYVQHSGHLSAVTMMMMMTNFSVREENKWKKWIRITPCCPNNHFCISEHIKGQQMILDCHKVTYLGSPCSPNWNSGTKIIKNINMFREVRVLQIGQVLITRNQRACMIILF